MVTHLDGAFGGAVRFAKGRLKAGVPPLVEPEAPLGRDMLKAPENPGSAG